MTNNDRQREQWVRDEEAKAQRLDNDMFEALNSRDCAADAMADLAWAFRVLLFLVALAGVAVLLIWLATDAAANYRADMRTASIVYGGVK